MGNKRYITSGQAVDARAKRLGSAVLWLGLLGAWNWAAAQELRLSPLLAQTLHQHPSVLQARSQAQAAGHDVAAAKWGRYPSVSSELRTDSSAAQSTVRLEQPLWSGGRINGRIDLSEAGARSAEAAVREAELNALTQVSTSFFEVLRFSERLASSEEHVREHQRLQDLIVRRQGADISPLADVTLAQTRLQQAISERFQQSRQLQSARHNLTQWAGLISGQPTAPHRIQYPYHEPIQDLVHHALSASAQRQRLLAQLDSGDAQIRIAQAQSWPTLVAGVQRQVSGPNVYNTDRNTAYVSLQFQPGAGLSAADGVKAARSKKEAAQNELQALELALENQVRSLANDIEALQAQLEPAQGLLQGVSNLVDSYLRQYQLGRKSWLDVLNVLREKHQAQHNLADVRHTLMQSQVRMLLLSGRITGQHTALIHE